MKEIKYIGVICMIMFFSCTDMLDVTPENSVTFTNYFKTEKDLFTSVNSIKCALRDNYAYNADNPPICKGVVNDTVGKDLGAWMELVVSRRTHSPIDVVLFWNGYYNVIAYANMVLDHSHKASIPKERIDYYNGQAYFYRAFIYFYIAQAWGDAPIVRNGLDVGPKARSPWYEVVDFAINDAKEAIKLLPFRKDLVDINGQKITKKDTPCKEIVYAFLSKAYAWKASLNNEPDLFNKAIEAATKVIDSPEYSLASDPEEVCTSVLVCDSDESIFEIQMLWNETNVRMEHFTTVMNSITWPVAHGTKGDIKEISTKILFSTVNKMYKVGDKRREAYFFKCDSMSHDTMFKYNKGYAYPYKFRKPLVSTEGYNKGKFLNIDQDKIVYRLADIILIRAECYARLGRDGLAIADLNRIRNRAGAPKYPNAGENDLRYSIFKEREKELIWECHRYFDVIRNGYYRTELSEAYSKLTDQDVANGALYLPVGQGAFSNNPLMLQNKYWLSRY